MPTFTRILLCLLTMQTIPRVAGAADRVLRVQDCSQTDQRHPDVVLQGAWGDGPGQFGRVNLASRPGPMDFAIVADHLYVLDSVNARIQLFDLDGAWLASVPLETRTADFLAVDDAGDFAVIDAFVRREVLRFDAANRMVSRTAIPQALGLPSAAFLEDGRLWIEERHNKVFELNLAAEDAGKAPQALTALAGRSPRYAQDSATRPRIQVSKNPTGGVALQHSGAGDSRRESRLEFARPVAAICGLDFDARSRVHLLVACTGDDNLPPAELQMVVLSADHEITETFRLPNQYITDHYRKVYVAADGAVYQMQTSGDGVTFVRWSESAGDEKGGR